MSVKLLKSENYALKMELENAKLKVSHIFLGITQWTKNSYNFQIIINKITPFEVYNFLLKCLDALIKNKPIKIYDPKF